MLGEQFLEVNRLRVHVNLSGEEADGFSQAADRIDVEPLDDGGLGSIGPGNEQPVAAFEHRLQTHRQDAFDGAGLAGESEFPHDGIVAGPVETDLAAAHQEPQRDRQVEAVGIFLQVGRSEVDHDPVDRAAVSGVDDRPLDAVRALLDGGFRQADENRLGHRRGRDIDLDFNGRSVDADQCVGKELGEHDATSWLETGATGCGFARRTGTLQSILSRIPRTNVPARFYQHPRNCGALW